MPMVVYTEEEVIEKCEQAVAERCAEIAAERDRLLQEVGRLTVMLAASTPPPSKKVSIEELEKMLNSDDDAPVTILPNGEVRVFK